MLLKHTQPSNTHTQTHAKNHVGVQSLPVQKSWVLTCIPLPLHTHTHTLFPTATMLQNKAIVARSDWAAAVAMQPSKRSQ